MDDKQIKLELLKLVWPGVIDPDPAVAIAKAETLFAWVNRKRPAPRKKADKSN